MKREHTESNDTTWYEDQKGKMPMPDDSNDDDDNDELLAALGYKVRSSDMADVAQKIELLQMAMGNNTAPVPDHTVHYNPSDLSNWLDNMLSDINDTTGPDRKRPKPTLGPTPIHPSSSTSSTSSSSRSRCSYNGRNELSVASTVLLDTQEAGVRLVHALLACAEAVQKENPKAAESLLTQITLLAASQSGAMRKVAGYFADALARRIYRMGPPTDAPDFDDLLHGHFFDSCPYLKFAHFTANQAILDAFAGHRHVHVIDFGIKQGLQWPALLQALALRPTGPPTFQLTAVAPRRSSDAMQQVGWKLAEFADAVGVQFQFQTVAASSLDDLRSCGVGGGGGDQSEPVAVAVNSVFELHPLLARPGEIDAALRAVRAVRPKIVAVVEQEASLNSGSFLDRFTEALHYYSTMFDSLDSPAGSVDVAGAGGDRTDQVMSEMYLGNQICNVVACEGTDRTERHESLVQWRGRMVRAGFEPVSLGSNAFKQASMLLALFASGDGYRVEEKDGCLTLGWHTRPLIATSAWRMAAD